MQRSLPTAGDGVPRRFIAIGLALGLLAAALSLQGCVSVPGTGAGGGGGGAGQPVGASAVPSAPVASAAITVDLVPPGLVGRTWLIGGPAGELVAGILGSVGRVRIGGERPLAVGQGLVASVAADGTGSRVTVRSVPGGRVVASVVRPEEVLSAAFAGEMLIVGGHLPDSSGRDPGLVAILLRDGSVSALLPPRDLAGWRGDVARSVAVSPSGRTIVSGACTQERCAMDVIDVGTGIARRIADGIDAFPGVTTDEVVLVGDAESGWIAGIDLATGERRWVREDGEFQHAVPLADGTFAQAVVSASRGTFTLEVIDPSTGLGRAILTRDAQEGITLWPELSTDSAAVLGVGGRFADVALVGGLVIAGVVDVSSGDFTPGAVVIDLGG